MLEKTAKLPDPKRLGQGNYLIPGVFLQIRNPQHFIARGGVGEGVENTGDGGLPIADLPAGFRPGKVAELEHFPTGHSIALVSKAHDFVLGLYEVLRRIFAPRPQIPFADKELSFKAPAGFIFADRERILGNYRNSDEETLNPYECRVNLWK